MTKRSALLKSVGNQTTGKRGGKSSANDGLPKLYPGRTKNVAKRLEMYRDKGKLSQKQPDDPMARIEPARKWFDNTRVVDQSKLEQFREALVKSRADPRSAVVKATKLPVSLFDHSGEQTTKTAANLLTVAPYAETFSARRRQRRVNLGEISTVGDLAGIANQRDYDQANDRWLTNDITGEPDKTGPLDAVMLKGTSKRIWGELYKVVDSSDVLIEVLDVRDPMGTRCFKLEKHLREDKPFKQVVLLLNKCDLVPPWVTEKWVKLLSSEYPTVAFKASIDHPFGKRALIGLLRQYGEMFRNRKHVSVGIFGYPNVGKSSVINTLRGKKVCNTAPIPGETKVWQYIDLTSKLYLIDCPGISFDNEDNNDTQKVIRGVVRAEKLDSPEDHMEAIFKLVTADKLQKIYNIDVTTVVESENDDRSSDAVLAALAVKWQRLLKGGEPNRRETAVKVINDLQRGKLPWFVMPPNLTNTSTEQPPPSEPDAQVQLSCEV